jgi:nucleoid DNA-binding protein
MNKQELIDLISSDAELPKIEVDRVLDSFMRSMSNVAIAHCHSTTVIGFKNGNGVEVGFAVILDLEKRA